MNKNKMSWVPDSGSFRIFEILRHDLGMLFFENQSTIIAINFGAPVSIVAIRLKCNYFILGDCTEVFYLGLSKSADSGQTVVYKAV